MCKHTPFVLCGKEEQVCRMYQRGFNAYEIANKFRVSSKSIYRCLEKQGIPRKRYRGYCLKPVKKDLVKLYQKGIPLASLAKKFDCCYETIISFLKNEGVPKRPTDSILAHKKPKIGRLMRQESFIEELYRKGLSYEDIGKKVGARSENICHFVRERGWTRARAIHKNSFIPQTDLILKLYKKEHLSASKIAQKIGCDSTTVRRILKSNGITARDYLEANIKKLYDQGLSYKEIGERLGKDITGICHFVKSRGWTRPVIKRDRSTYRTKAKT